MIHIQSKLSEKKLGPLVLKYRGVEYFSLVYAFREHYIFLATHCWH